MEITIQIENLTWLMLIQQYIPKAVATSSSNCVKHGPTFLLQSCATPNIVPVMQNIVIKVFNYFIFDGN